MRLHPTTCPALLLAALVGCASGTAQPDGGSGSDAGNGSDAGGVLAVTAPNGGEVWLNGASVTIEWSASGLAASTSRPARTIGCGSAPRPGRAG